jgi:hypothetical protein
MTTVDVMIDSGKFWQQMGFCTFKDMSGIGFGLLISLPKDTNIFLKSYLPTHTLAGFDLATHSSNPRWQEETILLYHAAMAWLQINLFLNIGPQSTGTSISLTSSRQPKLRTGTSDRSPFWATTASAASRCRNKPTKTIITEPEMSKMQF